MGIRSAPRLVSLILSVTLLAAGCGGPARSGATATDEPSPSAVASPAVPPGPSHLPAASESPAASSTEPPTASLAAEGGDAVVGQLGSFTWAGGGSDSPWLPGSPVRVGTGEPLTVAIAGHAAIAEWSARRVPAGTTNGVGATSLGTGAGGAPIAFAAPGVGRWSVQVMVRFAADQGDAAYYWELDVR